MNLNTKNAYEGFIAIKLNEDGNVIWSELLNIETDKYAELYCEEISNVMIGTQDNGILDVTSLEYYEGGMAESISYQKEYMTDIAETYLIKYTPEMKDVNVKIVWEDKDNKNSVRPEKLELTLKNGKEIIKTVELSASNEWAYVFENMPKYDENDKEIVYTIEVEGIEDGELFRYTTKIENGQDEDGKDDKDQIIVTNQMIESSKVIVKYVDKATGEEIEPSVTKIGVLDEKYDVTGEKKEMEGYVLVTEPEEKTGTFTEEEQEVVFEYAKKSQVIVKYVEKDTNKELLKEEKIDGFEGKEYKTEEKKFKYYNLSEKPENAEGKMTAEEMTITYVYDRKPFNLKLEKEIESIELNGNSRKVNGDIGKVELYRKGVSSNNLKVVYKIKVVNDGEIDGKAVIRENIPEGLRMEEGDNIGWEIKGEEATIETEEIKAGESKEYRVELEWIKNARNIGTMENMAEIISTSNEAGFEEINKEDNRDEASLIIAIGTGAEEACEIVMAVMAIGAMLLALMATNRMKVQVEEDANTKERRD